MNVSLSPEQQQALDQSAGHLLHVTDPRTSAAYLLVPAELDAVDLQENAGRPRRISRRRLIPPIPPSRRSVANVFHACRKDEADARGRTAVLCGRNAVQLSHPGAKISLDELAQELKGVGQLTRNQFLLRLKVEGYELTVFPDAWAIVSGTDDIVTARAIYAKYVGS